MNITRKLQILFTLLIALPISASDFVNLDFETPDLSHAVPYTLPDSTSAPTSEALRGWTVTGLASPALDRTIIYEGDLPPLDLTAARVVPGSGVDFGKYSLNLSSPSGTPVSLLPVYHLNQSGTIPLGAKELIYYRSGPNGSPSDPSLPTFKILINGASIPYAENRFTPVATVDVSAYAGQNVSLEFIFPKGETLFDVAGFNIVPEPSTCALLGLGAAALGWHCRRRSHS